MVDSSIQASRSARAIRFCIGKFDPDGRVIARVFPGPHIAVDAGSAQAAGKGWAQQQVIDAQSGVAGKGVPEIFPECVDPLIRVEDPQRVGPALCDQALIGVAHLGPEQRVIDPALRRIDIEIGRHHVEIAGQNDIIKRPVLVDVSAHGSASDRNCPPASTMPLTMANGPKVERASRSIRVTVTTSPGASAFRSLSMWPTRRTPDPL